MKYIWYMVKVLKKIKFLYHSYFSIVNINLASLPIARMTSCFISVSPALPSLLSGAPLAEGALPSARALQLLSSGESTERLHRPSPHDINLCRSTRFYTVV